MRRQVMPSHHHRPAHLEHARAARAIGDDPVQQPEVDSRFFPYHHRFGGGQVVYGHQQVGDELELGAGAELAAVISRAREPVEYLAAAVEHPAVAARVDRDVLGGRLGAGAADRAVEHMDATARQTAAQPLLQLERHGARLDHDRAGPGAGSNALLAEIGFLHRSRGRQRRDDDPRPRRDLGTRARRLTAQPRQSPARGRRYVVADDVEAGIEQVARESAAHDTQPHLPDRAPAAAGSPLSSCRITIHDSRLTGSIGFHMKPRLLGFIAGQIINALFQIGRRAYQHVARERRLHLQPVR